MDVVDKKTRSRMMSQIRAIDTKPEMIVRRGLHAKGLRYRLHDKSLPGRPDILFPKYNAAIHVHGCFWHKHECRFFKWPSTRPDFWRDKLYGNEARDKKNIILLDELGIRSLIIWECALRGRSLKVTEKVISYAYDWVTDSESNRSNSVSWVQFR